MAVAAADDPNCSCFPKLVDSDPMSCQKNLHERVVAAAMESGADGNSYPTAIQYWQPRVVGAGCGDVHPVNLPSRLPQREQPERGPHQIDQRRVVWREPEGSVPERAVVAAAAVVVVVADAVEPEACSAAGSMVVGNLRRRHHRRRPLPHQCALLWQ